jgi:hypothetical protein
MAMAVQDGTPVAENSTLPTDMEFGDSVRSSTKALIFIVVSGT